MKVARVEHPHTELEGEDDYHEWVDVWLREHEEERGPGRVRLDSLGRKNGGWYDWKRWCCNNTECDGVLLVNQRALEKFVNDAYDTLGPRA